MVSALAYHHSSAYIAADVTLYQPVDDMSALVTAPTKSSVVKAAYNFAVEFKERTDRLHLETSTKTTIQPDNESTRKVAQLTRHRRIPEQTSPSGNDIGVDCAAAQRRCTRV